MSNHHVSQHEKDAGGGSEGGVEGARRAGTHDACGSVGPMAGSSRLPGSALPRLSRAMGLTTFLTLSRRIYAAELRFGMHAATSRTHCGDGGGSELHNPCSAIQVDEARLVVAVPAERDGPHLHSGHLLAGLSGRHHGAVS